MASPSYRGRVISPDLVPFPKDVLSPTKGVVTAQFAVELERLGRASRVRSHGRAPGWETVKVLAPKTCHLTLQDFVEGGTGTQVSQRTRPLGLWALTTVPAGLDASRHISWKGTGFAARSLPTLAATFVVIAIIVAMCLTEGSLRSDFKCYITGMASARTPNLDKVFPGLHQIRTSPNLHFQDFT